MQTPDHLALQLMRPHSSEPDHGIHRMNLSWWMWANQGPVCCFQQLVNSSVLLFKRCRGMETPSSAMGTADTCPGVQLAIHPRK